MKEQNKAKGNITMAAKLARDQLHILILKKYSQNVEISSDLTLK